MSTRNTKPSSVTPTSSAISLRAGALAARGASAPSWVEEDQVDVGGDVQLAAAELAHRRPPPARVAPVHPALRRSAARPGRSSSRRLRSRSALPGQVARHDAQQHALAQAAQPALERGLVVARAPCQRRRHARRARTAARRGQFGGQLGMRRRARCGVARKGDFANRIWHLRLEWSERCAPQELSAPPCPKPAVRARFSFETHTTIGATQSAMQTSDRSFAGTLLRVLEALAWTVFSLSPRCFSRCASGCCRKWSSYRGDLAAALSARIGLQVRIGAPAG